MGQKIHPNGFRVGITRGWNSRWYADKATYGSYLVEDTKIREFAGKRLKMAGVAKIEIERTGEEVRVLLNVARPGIVIGRKHTEIDRVREEIQRLTGKRVVINVREVANPDGDSQLLAESVAAQLLKRSSFRRAMRRAVESAMGAGCLGIKIVCSGRLGGAEMSRVERYVEGKLPLHNLSADIQYGFAEASTTYGKIGVKVWLNKGKVKKESARAADAKAG